MEIRLVFQTLRLLVRELTPADIEFYHDLQGDAEVMRFITGKAFTREENRCDLQRVLSLYRKENNVFWVWAVVRKEDGEFLGTCALVGNNDGEQEIGYRFRRCHWGRGFATEVLQGLVEYVRGADYRNGLVAYVNRENKASVRVLEKSVFTFVREFFNQEEQCWDREYRVTFN